MRVMHRRKHRKASARAISSDRDDVEVMFYGSDGRLIVQRITGTAFTAKYRIIQPDEPR